MSRTFIFLIMLIVFGGYYFVVQNFDFLRVLLMAAVVTWAAEKQ